MNCKKIIIIIVALFFVAVVVSFLRGDEDTWICEKNQWVRHGNPDAEKPLTGCGEDIFKINNFNDCVNVGYPVMESYPRQCQDGEEKIYIEEIEQGNANIILDYPKDNQIITSPLEITGEAKGIWYFEASFPVILTNWDGLIIAEGIAQAQGDWMTEKFVPFKAILEFKNDLSVSNRGSLILKKDNPSGLPENDDALEISVFFE